MLTSTNLESNKSRMSLTKKQVRHYYKIVQRILRNYYHNEKNVPRKGTKFFVLKDLFFKEFAIKKTRFQNEKLILVKVYLSGKNNVLRKGSDYSKRKKSSKKFDYKQKYYDYLKSNEWAQIKLDLYESRCKQCEVCESKRNVQVHHLTYKNVFNEEPEDLILLCKNCHEKEHGIK